MSDDALYRLGPLARLAVPKLVNLLYSPYRDHHREACWLLWRIDPAEARRLKVPELTLPLCDLLKSES